MSWPGRLPRCSFMHSTTRLCWSSSLWSGTLASSRSSRSSWSSLRVVQALRCGAAALVVVGLLLQLGVVANSSSSVTRLPLSCRAIRRLLMRGPTGTGTGLIPPCDYGAGQAPPRPQTCRNREAMLATARIAGAACQTARSRSARPRHFPWSSGTRSCSPPATPVIAPFLLRPSEPVGGPAGLPGPVSAEEFPRPLPRPHAPEKVCA